MSAKKFALSILLVITILAAACVPATQAPPVTPPTQAPQPTQPPAAPPPTSVPPTAAPTATTQAQAKVATFIFTQEFDNLNPAYTNMWFSDITQQLWNCWAWDYDEKNNPLPVLVKEMPSISNGGISADGKTITMKLRDDAVWSDGTPITSDDFKFTADMYVEKKNTVATTAPYDVIKSIDTPDAGTVVINFNDPYAAWQGLWHGLLPSHILKPIFDTDGTLDKADWNRNPTVGCGPYVLDKWESGSYARFLANPKYWGPKPKIDQIFVRFVPDDASQIAALKTGDGDLGAFIAYSDIPALEQVGIQVVKAFSGYNEGVYFYLDPVKGHPALQDVNVRKAIVLAIDRFSLDKDLLLGKTVPAATYYDETPWVDPSLKPYPYDPEQAKQLLDAAGWKVGSDGVREKGGKKLELKYGTTTREIRKDTQAVVQQQLAAVGIKVDLLNYESDLFFSGFGDNGPAATGQLDMFEYSTTTLAFPDPDVSEWLCNDIPSKDKPTGTNWMAICDKDLDQLIQLQTKQVDFSQRQQTFYKITKLIFDKVYFFGMWQDPDQWAVGKRLLNVKISGSTPFFNVVEWDLSQ
jgi:peptide/nickel transport system substrate-binding protein